MPKLRWRLSSQLGPGLAVQSCTADTKSELTEGVSLAAKRLSIRRVIKPDGRQMIFFESAADTATTSAASTSNGAIPTQGGIRVNPFVSAVPPSKQARERRPRSGNKPI